MKRYLYRVKEDNNVGIDGTTGINRQALFSSETEDYRSPLEPDVDSDVMLRFRTGKNDIEHAYYVEDGQRWRWIRSVPMSCLTIMNMRLR